MVRSLIQILLLILILILILIILILILTLILILIQPGEPKPIQPKPESPKATVYRDKREAMDALRDLLKVSVNKITVKISLHFLFRIICRDFVIGISYSNSLIKI